MNMVSSGKPNFGSVDEFLGDLFAGTLSRILRARKPVGWKSRPSGNILTGWSKCV